MEDILASIRRILSEEESPPGGGGASPPDEDVLILDSSMMVEEQAPVHPDEASPREHQPHATEATQGGEAPSSLVAPSAAAAAASSVGSLVRTLAGRTTQVHGGGPTIEDIVRDELRPMLKQWLDTYLPGTVERLVRAEIERVVGRADL